MFVAQYNGATGAHQWSKGFGGAYDRSAANSVAVDGAGNVYFTGYFRGVVDFGGGQLQVTRSTPTSTSSSPSSPSAARTRGSKNFANDGNDHGYGIAVDGQGNVAIAGSFSNSINFGGGDLVSPNAMTDAFVADFTTSGAYRWAAANSARPMAARARAASQSTRRGNVVVVGAAVKGIRLRWWIRGRRVRQLRRVRREVRSRERCVPVGPARRRNRQRLRERGCGRQRRQRARWRARTRGSANFAGATVNAAGQNDGFVLKLTERGCAVVGSLLRRSPTRTGSTRVSATPGTGANPVAGGYFYGSGMFEGTAQTSAGMADGVVVRTTP